MLLENHNAIESGGYQIANSLRFQAASSQYLSRTPASAGNRKTWTYSGWVKRGALASINGWLLYIRGSETDSTFMRIGFDIMANDCLSFTAFNNSALNLTTTQVFRDTSAWYHIIVAFDTTQATASNRVKIYVNGTQVTAFSTANYPALNADFGINNNTSTIIGASLAVSNYYYDGYMTEINFIDGQQLTPSSFGETNTLTGQWVAKKYTGVYGVNGFYLPFSNGTSTTTLGNDGSGNANHWALNNFTRSPGTTDCWMYDVPSGNGSSVGGTQPNSNYAVMNPLEVSYQTATLSKANLTLSTSGTYWSGRPATIAVNSGKWYWEYTTSGGTTRCGITPTGTLYNASNPQDRTNAVQYEGSTGNKWISGSSSAYGASYSSADVIGVALDADAGTVVFYKNNTSQGSITLPSGAGALVNPAFYSAGDTVNANFGQRSFAYTPPSGFKALCTANLPASTIVKGNQYMDATLYTGNNTPRSITNAAGFSPDLVWIKDRSTAYSNIVYDIVRGTGTANLATDNTQAEGYNASYANLTSFNTNGFSLGNTSLVNVINNNGDTYVAWQWDAGSSTVTNTNGSISSQVRANPTAGVSVITYTGTGANATVGHGLGVAPKMIIVKGRNVASDWIVYHQGQSASPQNGYLVLNRTDAYTASAIMWNNTAPSSSVITLGSNLAAAYNFVAYAFAEIAGFSKFGSYTGNGSTDGVFVATNFKPKFVMIKSSSIGGGGYDWIIYDSARNTYNVIDKVLSPNTSSAEQTRASVDFLSNGFKMRLSGATENSNGQTYIYAAFAESPFSSSNAV